MASSSAVSVAVYQDLECSLHCQNRDLQYRPGKRQPLATKSLHVLQDQIRSAMVRLVRKQAELADQLDRLRGQEATLKQQAIAAACQTHTTSAR